ncbi:MULTISPECIES: hypothetical protein [unclassified Sphingomonas]|uniref:hypothetical protein n=1 Tax=unclassified Sphingomonas TaxID=196159 RepID=UPI001F57428A|nr:MULTISPECIES: hypothetical protein [unclassified Sphingomonas]
MKALLPFAALLSLGTSAAFAQSTTQSANAEAAARAAAPSAADAVNARNQAQYESDMASYARSLRANHREAVRDEVHYDHQRRAYADAMADWRNQVYACRHGHTRACKAPTPNPANYY